MRDLIRGEEKEGTELAWTMNKQFSDGQGDRTNDGGKDVLL